MKRTISWTLAYLLIITFEVSLPARAKGANEHVTYLQSQMQEARTKEEAAKAKAAQLHRQIEAATVKAQQLRTATKKLTAEFQAQKKALESAKSELSKVNAAKQSEVERKLAEAQTLEQMIKSQMPGVSLGGGAEAEEVWKKINDKYYTNFMNPKVFGLQKEVEEATHSLRTMLDKMAEIPLTRKAEGIAIDNEYVKVRDEKIPELQKKLDAAIEECRKQVREGMSALSAKEAEIGKADPDASVKNAIEKVREAEAKTKELERKVIEASVAEANADRGPMDDYKKAVEAYADATSLRQSREKELAQARAEEAAAAKPTPSPSATIPKEDLSSVTKATPSTSPAVSDEVVVPDLGVFDGLTEMQAVARHAGLVPVLVATKATPPPGKNRLFVTTNPLPGAKAKKGSVLQIMVYQKAAQTSSPSPSPLPTSSPDAPGTMPDLTGLTLDQAMTRLAANMTIGGDEVGEKPPSEEKAFKIYAQTPAVGAKISTDKKVIVTVKRYGSGKVEPEATPPEQSSTIAGSGDLEGEWEGMIGAEKDKQKASFTISRQNGDYYVSMPGQKATRGKMENGKLVMEAVLDLSGTAPFSFGGPPVESKDTDPARLKIFFSASGDDLTVDVTVTTRKEGEKRAHLGTIHRKKAG